MTRLERFIKVLEFKSLDRVPNWEGGVWPETLERWHQEGLPKDAVHRGNKEQLSRVEELVLGLDTRSQHLNPHWLRRENRILGRVRVRCRS